MGEQHRVIHRTHPKMLVLEHLYNHGRTDPETIGEQYLSHLHSDGKNAPETVRRSAARQLFKRMEALGLVRILRDDSAKITAFGTRFLFEEESCPLPR